MFIFSVPPVQKQLSAYGTMPLSSYPLVSAIVKIRSKKHFASAIPRYLIFALLIFTPLARGSVHGWAVTVIHIVTLIALTAYLLEKTLTGDWKWIKTPLDKPIICLLLLCLLSAVFSVHRYTSIGATILLVNYLTIFYLIIHTVRTRSQFRHLVYLIIGVATFLSVFGLFKNSGMNPCPWWHYPEITQNVHRLASTYGNANHLAGYMEMAILLLLGYSLTGITGSKRLLMVAIAFVLFLSLLFSLSRGGWIGAVIGLFFMALALSTGQEVKKRKFIVALVAGIIVVGVIILSSTATVERILALEKKEGLEARMRVWSGVINLIENYPLLGVGPGTFATVYTQYQPPGFDRRYFMAHNDYLQFIAELGVILIPIMLWMMVNLYKKGFQKLKNPSRLVRGITIGALAGIAAILVHSAIDFNLHIPANALLFSVLAALVVAPIPGDL